MAYTEPKTDWVSEDFFNLADYTRIKNNLDYISNLGNKMYSFSVEAIESAAITTTYLTSRFNAIENNLRAINRGSYRFSLTTKEWQDNKLAPDYTDFNRWETMIQLLYNTLDAQYRALPRLAFTLGGQKGVRL